MELEGDADALVAALSFVGDVFDFAVAELSGAVDASSSPLTVQGSVAVSSDPPPPGFSSELDGVWPPESDHSGNGGFDLGLAGFDDQAGWTLTRSDGAAAVSTSSGSDGDLNADEAISDALSSSTRLPIVEANAGSDAPDASVKGKPAERSGSRKRPASYNPNRARDEQLRELRSLRAEAAELEEQLAVLGKLRPHQRLVEGNSSQEENTSDSIAANVWKAMADRQLQKRMAST